MHAMISVLLPFLQWKFAEEKGDQTGPLIAKWFKLAACTQASDAYWDPCDECLKNTSNKMLEMVTNQQKGRELKLRRSPLTTPS